MWFLYLLSCLLHRSHNMDDIMCHILCGLLSSDIVKRKKSTLTLRRGSRQRDGGITGITRAGRTIFKEVTSLSTLIFDNCGQLRQQ